MAAGAPPADGGVRGQQVMPTILIFKIQGSVKKTIKSIQNPSNFFQYFKMSKNRSVLSSAFLLVIAVLGPS